MQYDDWLIAVFNKCWMNNENGETASEVKTEVLKVSLHLKHNCLILSIEI